MALTAAQITIAFENVLQRAPSGDDVNALTTASQSGFFTDAQVYGSIVNSPEANANVDPVIRDYQVAFGRVPDKNGLHFNVNAFEASGQNLKSISEAFSHSPEFATQYGSGEVVTEGYLQSLYAHALDRSASAVELHSWLEMVNTPGSGYAMRADVLNGFAQSPEFIARSDAAVNDFLFKAAQGQDVYAAHPLLGGADHFFTATVGVDNLVGTSGNDTYNSVISAGLDATLTAGDTVQDQGGSDVLNAIVHSSAGTPLTIAGVETINLDTSVSSGSAALTVELNDAAATTITVSGTHGVNFGESSLPNVTALNASGVAGTGAAGAVVFDGSAHRDAAQGLTIKGGAGNDVFAGGYGADTFTGGAGNDVFVYGDLNQSTTAHMDTITDFHANTISTPGAPASQGAGQLTSSYNGDVLDFTALFAGKANGVELRVVPSEGAALSLLRSDVELGGSNAFALFDASKSNLYVDVDHNGAADAIIHLAGVASITEAAIRFHGGDLGLL
ncbi:DUF4214 domain-containing protein [Methylobacterium soli]|uniref:DUF4214 domain-containing protein n=1 Tax=Methylobacterium soli TaxID=553447 RepID=A0A6L3SRK9_9HYPH|nr:DUF4214 domain-containing protein [Methylobacterium soli]KAB1068131.1 DUF4214 domain-containing protein [Methylobacterium soli]GJE45685.1 hypothetical protein AEGHOMDF_4885 [Methylobacterium soli]